MTMDVSRLAIEVSSSGIQEATTALQGRNGKGGLAGAAAKAETSVDNLTQRMQKLMGINMSGSMQAWNSALGGLQSTLAQINTVASQTAAALQQVAAGINTAAGAAQRGSAAQREYNSHSGVFVNTLKAMSAAALAYFSINSAKSIVEQADSWQMLQSRLQIATGSLNNAKVAQNQMFDLAQKLHSPLEEQVKLYTRLAPAMQRMGKSSDDAKDTVEGIATALKLGGANGAEMSSVMLQLSQSYGSGVLNGAEFNAVSENGQVIMKALIDAHIKYKGKVLDSSSALKKMGSDGALTMDIVNDAIMKALPKWREQFMMLPVTFDGAMENLKNAWTKAIGEMGQDTGFNKQLAGALLNLQDMIPGIAKGLGNAFIAVMGWLKANSEAVGQIWDQVKGLVSDVWKLVSGLSAWFGEVTGLNKEFSLLGFALFSIRLALAAIQDLFTGVVVIVASLVAGIDVGIVHPLVWLATHVMKLLIDGFSEMFSMMSKGAKFVGLDSLGDGMAEAAKMGKDLSTTLQNISDTSGDIADSFVQVANDYATKLSSGKGALATLLNGEEKITAEKKKQIGIMDPAAWGANENPPKPPVKPNAAAKRELDAYTLAVTTLNDKLTEQYTIQDRLSKFGLQYDKMTEGQRDVIKYEDQLQKELAKGDAASQLRLKHIGYELALSRELAEVEIENARTKKILQAEDNNISGENALVESLRKETEALEAKVSAYGKAKGAAEVYELTLAKNRLADMEATSDSSRTDAMTQMIALLQQEVGLRERSAKAAEFLGSKATLEEIDKLMDPAKAKDFTAALTSGFGRVGKALGVVVNAMDKWQDKTTKQEKLQKDINKLTRPEDAEKKANLQVKYNEMVVQDTISTYADMAGAAKGFFGEHTKGYAILEAAEKTFRAFEMAMAVESFLEKSGLLAAFTGLFVTAKTVETGAELASVAPHVAAEGVKQGANAITALTSALAAPWPLNLAAFAMVAAMLAAIGVAVGGGGGGGKSLSVSRQEKQGTGTVFGDSSAKSDSIAKSLDILSNNSDIALSYSQGMLSSLQNIEYSLTGATSGVLRTGGSVTGSGYNSNTKLPSMTEAALLTGPIGVIANVIGKVLGGTIGSFLQKLTGFSSSSSLKDSGLIGANQSVANILSSGFNVKAYQDVQTKKSAFGITYSNKTSTKTSEVDSAVNKEFTTIIGGMVDTLVAASGALGMSTEDVRKKLEAMNIDIGKISLKGLSSDEIQKQLEAVFSAIGDKLTTGVFADSLNAFQKAGEGLLETAVRVASGVDTAKYELEKLGLTAINFADIINKSGDVGAEIVRQSILVEEAGTGIGNIISTLTGTASEIASTYSSLLEVQGSLKMMGIADEVSVALIRAAGGLDALQNSLSSYYDNFFSDSEKAAMQTSTLAAQFNKLGLLLPTTKDGFRALVESLTASGNEELAVKVLNLADAFSQLSDTTDGLLTDARSNLSDAYDRESSSLTDLKTKFEDFSKSLGEFKDSLLTGDLSTLSGMDKYYKLKSDFETISAKAMAGDETAIAGFQDAANAFLTSSRDMYSSSDTYTADFQKVLDLTNSLETSTAGQASMAQQQLDALDKQVAGLIDINTSVQTVAEAIAALTALMTGTSLASVSNGGQQTIMPVDGTNASALSYSSSASTDALVEEVKALRAEVSALRSEQAQQTGALIASTYDANAQNAQAVVDGTKDAASINTYHGKAMVELA